MTTRTIQISAVYSDGHVTDHEFRADVERFTRQYMPSVSMHLLGAENREDYDEWEMLLDYDCCTRFVVEEHELIDGDGDVWYFVRDTETDIYHGTSGEIGEEINADNIEDGWYDAGDAEDFAVQSERDDYTENCHGFPFAHGWGYLLTERSLPDNDDLYRHGFVVFEFRGERIAGIDGGGYNFTDQHFAPLYIELAQRYGWQVQTEQGPAHFARDPEDAPDHCGDCGLIGLDISVHRVDIDGFDTCYLYTCAECGFSTRRYTKVGGDE